MPRTVGLTERMRKFVAEYRGEGDGARAARAAGYAGSDKAISVQVARLLKDPRIAEELERKRREVEERRLERAAGWTTTERLAELREIGECRERGEDGEWLVSPLDRIRAIRLASEITGDIGRNRLDPPGPASSPAPATDDDAEAREDQEDPAPHLPPRLLLVKERSDG